MTPPHIEIRHGLVWHHVVIVGANGQVMFTSETFYSRSNARRAAVRIGDMTGWEIKP